MAFAVNLHGQVSIFFWIWISVAYAVNLHGQAPIFFQMDFCVLYGKFTRTSSYFFSRYGFLWPLL